MHRLQRLLWSGQNFRYPERFHDAPTAVFGPGDVLNHLNGVGCGGAPPPNILAAAVERSPALRINPARNPRLEFAKSWTAHALRFLEGLVAELDCVPEKPDSAFSISLKRMGFEMYPSIPACRQRSRSPFMA
jgi:hypothetical protein